MRKNDHPTSGWQSTEKCNSVYILFGKKNMRLLLCIAITIFLSSNLCFSQINFSAETKKYIDSTDPVTVSTNVLLIHGTGGPANPHQTVIIRNGKIEWVGDDAKAP